MLLLGRLSILLKRRQNSHVYNQAYQGSSIHHTIIVHYWRHRSRHTKAKEFRPKRARGPGRFPPESKLKLWQMILQHCCPAYFGVWDSINDFLDNEKCRFLQALLLSLYSDVGTLTYEDVRANRAWGMLDFFHPTEWSFSAKKCLLATMLQLLV
jgi:hypothetical protein